MQWAEINLILQFAAGSIFLFSGLSKLRSPAAFTAGIRKYQLAAPAAAPAIASLVIAAEFVIGLSQLSGRYVGVSSMLAVMTLGVFLVAVVSVLRRGDAVPCLCFGSNDEFVSTRSIVRLVALLLAEVALWAFSAWAETISNTPRTSTEEMILAALTAAMLLVLARWLFDLPLLYALLKSQKVSRRCLEANSVNTREG